MVLVIAEIGINHNGDIDIAKSLLMQGVENETIAKATGLKNTEVKKLKKDIRIIFSFKRV